MRWFLRLHGMLESMAGLVLLFRPDVLLMAPTVEVQGLVLAKLYGILAFFFGICSLILQQAFAYNLLFKRLTLALITFHFCVGLYMHGLYTQHITPHAGAALLHLVIAVAGLLVFLRQSNQFDEA